MTKKIVVTLFLCRRLITTYFFITYFYDGAAFSCNGLLVCVRAYSTMYITFHVAIDVMDKRFCFVLILTVHKSAVQHPIYGGNVKTNDGFS